MWADSFESRKNKRISAAVCPFCIRELQTGINRQEESR